jgi:hypothetical protein
MFTPGSKYLLGLAGFSAAFMVAYIVVTDQSVGGAVALVSVAAALGLLAGLGLFNRDGDVRVGDTSAAANATPVGASLWPLVATLGVVLLSVGLLTHEIVFLLGLVAVSAAFVEWVIQSWSESASSDAEFNTGARARLLHPLEFPVLATVGLGVIIVSFSRIMLALSRDAGAIVFILVASGVLFAGSVFALKPKMKKTLVAGLCTIGAVGIVAGGIAAASNGNRAELVEAKEEGHFTHKECGEEKSKYFDDEAEKTVSMRSNPIATIELVDGKLQARELGVEGYSQRITVPRANDVTVIFRNKSEGKHRLVLFMGTEQVQEGVTEDILTCTQMIGSDSEQALTFKLNKSSYGQEKPFAFTVPGLDGQSIEAIVP